MENLDIVCLENISYFLDWKDFFNLSHVNRKLYKLSQKLLWKDELSKEYESDKCYTLDLDVKKEYKEYKEYNNSYKEYYTRCKLGKGVWIQYHIETFFETPRISKIKTQVWKKINGHINNYDDYVEYPALFLLGHKDITGKFYVLEFINIYDYTESHFYISDNIENYEKYSIETYKIFPLINKELNIKLNEYFIRFYEMKI